MEARGREAEEGRMIAEIFSPIENLDLSAVPVSQQITRPREIAIKLVKDTKKFDDFLLDADRVLGWINQASALETSRLINSFFLGSAGQKPIHYKNIYMRAEKECNNDIFGKNFILLCLIYPKPLKPPVVDGLKLALQDLQQSEPDNFKHVIKMASVRINPSNKNIRRASNSFMNLNYASLAKMDFNNIQMQGAFLKYANLNGCCFLRANLQGIHLEKTSLTSANVSEACLSEANLRFAILCDSDLSNTDLTHTDLSYADLSRVNLHHTNLIGVNLTGTTLTSVRFFTNKSFATVAAFQKECLQLSTMLTQHAFRNELLTAILKDLIDKLSTSKIDLVIEISKAALEDKLFTQHEEDHYLKTVNNFVSSSLVTASSVISNTVFGWFSKSPTAPCKNPDYIPLDETKSQVDLPQLLQKLKDTSNPKQRPAAPQYSPCAPTNNIN